MAFKLLNILKLYSSFVLPTLEYASVVWSSIKRSNSRVLDFVQNSATRLALSALSQTPVVVMEAETSVIPLYLRRKKFLTFQIQRVVKHAPTSILRTQYSDWFSFYRQASSVDNKSFFSLAPSAYRLLLNTHVPCVEVYYNRSTHRGCLITFLTNR